ncbi:Rpn family recombination-promoting nuclease/putative transposase [Robertmurraya andreesenii]|uniref:Transposase/invertase (TIGR01784 family) n=1 Tax=Anoxybacillus andreesenii TaxID=1325932 RepID=A0ABT9V165_9BACL|nr:Rpn family recombination-promoting nuclease/putative transposase [Robertmurraya andreesenii]MDQ0154651.1 putative transposase/invertase (TIGR01784 family) [Robertmurraya andreesenii]
MTKEYLDLKIDFMFKQMFGQPSRKHITLAFINDLLGREGADRIKDLTFVNTELIKDRDEGKTSRLDMAVVTEAGEHINIEIQVRNQHDMPERILYYWAKTYSSLIHSGENYHQLTPVIFISILNYSLFPTQTDEFHTVFHIREDSENILWSNQLEFHLFDLRKFMVKWRKYRRKNRKETPWLLMFTATDFDTKKVNNEILSDLEEWAMNIEQVREALIEWETLSANKENRVVFEARAKELRDLLSNLEGERRLGREEGRERGRQEGLKQVAIKLLKDGMSVEQVARYVELPVEVIEEWVHNLE